MVSEVVCGEVGRRTSVNNLQYICETPGVVDPLLQTSVHQTGGDEVVGAGCGQV